MNGVLLHLQLRLPEGQLDHFRAARLSEQLETLRSLGVWQPGDGADGGLEDAGVPADPTIGDLLAHLRQRGEMGDRFFEVAIDRTGGLVAVRGGLADWYELNLYRLGLYQMATAAHPCGGRGHISLLGELEGEIVLGWIDVEDDGPRFSTPDPQDTPEEVWQERLDGVEALETAWKKWRRRHKRG